MLNARLLKQLVKFGLSEKEAAIYLVLLDFEAATVFEIAKTSGVNRSSAYVILEALKHKGFVGISDENKVREYVASSPETLLQSAKTAAKKQEEIKSNIESILPELKALHRATKRSPIVKVFEGDNGAKEVYGDLFLTNAKELRTYANPANILQRIPDFIKWHDKERGRRKIKLIAISPATEEVLKISKFFPPTKPADIRLIPASKFNFLSDIGIYADRVTIVSPKENFGIIIESKEIADMFKNSFDLAFEEAKRLDKKVIRRSP